MKQINNGELRIEEGKIIHYPFSMIN